MLAGESVARSRLLGAGIALLLLGALPLAAAGAGAVRRVHLGAEGDAVVAGDHRLYLETGPQRGEGLLRFARRLCGDAAAADAIARANGGVRRLVYGRRYRVPFEELLPALQVEVARGLFAADRARETGWAHRVGRAEDLAPESLWRIAAWFTGRGENYPQIRSHNHLHDDSLVPGQVVEIPAALLLPGLRQALPEPTPFDLEYVREGSASYAIYRLQAGEALYSSVVVRFTGRIYAEDVKRVAADLAALNGIEDVTDIPIGFAVKVPFDLLLPEFLPPGDPRRQAYEEGRLESSRFANRVRAARLEGVTVILDPGHGGVDVGTSSRGVWESLYVYDIALRVRRLLEADTAARVAMTVKDGDRYSIPPRDVLPFSRGHRVLTTPPYPIEDSTIGVHLRWYLANSIFRHAVDGRDDGDKVIFLSLHADSLHSSLRGAMAYIPAASLRGGHYSKQGTVYAARREYREAPEARFSKQDLLESEGLSRQLAGELIRAFQKERLMVHPYKPVRDRVIRQRRAWVPAVLRYNAVPAKVLLEVCNLANSQDRRLVQTQSYRQQVAKAVVEGILSYYGFGSAPVAGQVATATR